MSGETIIQQRISNYMHGYNAADTMSRRYMELSLLNDIHAWRKKDWNETTCEYLDTLLNTLIKEPKPYELEKSLRNFSGKPHVSYILDIIFQ